MNNMKRQKIIVADAEAPARLVIQEALGSHAYEFLDACNGFEIINHMKTAITSGHPVDLILLDRSMAGCSGQIILKYLASEEQPPRVVIMTGGFDTHAVLCGCKLKNVSVLPKPFKVAEIVNEVKRILLLP